MKLFNTVLRPHEFVAKAAVDFAKASFAKGHMGYCLGVEGHLLHITIAQIEAPDDFDISKLYNEISKLSWFSGKYIELGDYYHDDEKPYNGVNIKMSDDLKNLHNSAVKIHEDLGLIVKSRHSNEYWPHLTFSKNPNRLGEPVELPVALTGKSCGWKLEFGHMGDHGVYLGEYKPK